MKTLGAVLAGGQSRRFGSDKALALWCGRPLIDHVVDALADVAAAVAICGRPYRALPWLVDRPAAGLGPLPAINAALHHAAAHGFDRVLTLPCDVPAVAPALLRRLAAQRDAAFLAAMPVIGVWPVALAGMLDAHLVACGDRSIRRWAAAAGASPLAVPDDELPHNVNRPDDLVALGA